jgi:hypothetical protein
MAEDEWLHLFLKRIKAGDKLKAALCRLQREHSEDAS